jgi:hypothetical protein
MLFFNSPYRNKRAPKLFNQQKAVDNSREYHASHFKINKQLTHFLRYYNFLKNPQQNNTKTTSETLKKISILNQNNVNLLQPEAQPLVNKTKVKRENTNTLVKAKVSIFLRYKSITTNKVGRFSASSLSPRSRFMDPISLLLYSPKKSLLQDSSYGSIHTQNKKTAIKSNIKKAPFTSLIINGNKNSEPVINTNSSQSFLGYWLLWLSTLPVMSFAFFSTPPRFIDQQRHFLNNLNTLNSCSDRMVVYPSLVEPNAIAVPEWAKAYGRVVPKVTTKADLNSPKFLYKDYNNLRKRTTKFDHSNLIVYNQINDTNKNKQQSLTSSLITNPDLTVTKKIMPIKSEVILMNTFNFLNVHGTNRVLNRSTKEVQHPSMAYTMKAVPTFRSYHYILKTFSANTTNENQRLLPNNLSINNLKLLNLKMFQLKNNPTEGCTYQSPFNFLITRDFNQLMQSTHSRTFQNEEGNNKGVLFLYGQKPALSLLGGINAGDLRYKGMTPLFNINCDATKIFRSNFVGFNFVPHSSRGIQTIFIGANESHVPTLHNKNTLIFQGVPAYSQLLYRKMLNNYALKSLGKNTGWSNKNQKAKTIQLFNNTTLLKTNLRHIYPRVSTLLCLESQRQSPSVNIPLLNIKKSPSTLSLYHNDSKLQKTLVNKSAPYLNHVSNFSQVYQLNRPNNIIRSGSSYYFHYINKKIKHFTQLGNSGSPVMSRAKKTKLKQNKNITENSTVSILLKQKKMFKHFLNDQLSNYKEEEPTLYLDLQKKRKAKKQRLETRRQKKRIRLYPRPVWIRFRMFSDFLNRRTASNTKAFNIPNALQQKTYNSLHSNLGSQSQIDLRCHNSNQKAFTNNYSRKFNSWKENSLHQRNELHQLFVPGQKTNHLGLLEKTKFLVNHIKETKIKANYINFKPQKSDSQSDTNIFRDFWVWSYNNTINNCSNSLLLAPYSLRHYNKNEVTTNNFHHKDLIKAETMTSKPLYNLIHWSLNKIKNKSTFSPYNKRQTLWGLQKIRNQSKNNKTILISKQLQSYWHHFSVKKTLNLFNKKLYTKMPHSLQKIYYLNSLSFNNSSRAFTSSKKNVANFNGPVSGNKAVLKGEALYRKALFNSRRDLLQNIVVAPWFNSLNIKATSFSVPQIGEIFDGLLRPINSQSTRHGAEYIPVIVGLLFHFCAIISLISISQIRCFLKFHLILIYKISNFYNLFIAKISKFNFVKSLLPRQNNRKLINSQNYKVLEGRLNTGIDYYSRSKSSNKTNIPRMLNSMVYKNATIILKRKSFFKRGIAPTKSYLFKQKLYKLIIYTKNMFVKATFKFIDLFQSITREVSGFFEKPGEITTTWIAFGFLVEWSSDFLAIIPETMDIYVWNTFSKILRSVSTLQLFMGISQPLLNFKSTSVLLSNSHVRSYKFLGNWLSIGIPLPFFIHLVQRRIAVLFDFVIKTISQPDTDLIRRQQKGNLFWDVWGDYLLTAADQYNINIAALSTIKAEQTKLIDSISTGSHNTDNWSNKGQLNKTKSTMTGSISKKNGLMQRMTVTPYTNNIIGDLRLINDRSQATWAQTSLLPIIKKSLSKGTTQTQGEISVNRWIVNQFITYQSWSNNSDLFMDYHPPKSFENYKGHFINSNITLQQPLGTLVCQIYSGLFNKQISKNILLINSSTNYNQFNNTLLIQALAGETELKIITDNANRYAVVNRGFAIGIKLLRDVFDKIKLTTPCIFLLEDIHAIGERRPMLISDYGNDHSKNNELFQSQLDEVHEKNQVVYQSFFHAITHYKKPFKSNVTTTKYLTDLYGFLRTQSSNNLSLTVNNNTTIKPKMLNKNTNSSNTNQRYKTVQTAQNNNSLSTHLLIKKSTTPMHNPLLKSKNSKSSTGGIPKICNEFPWGGLTGEQLATKPRISYSIRSKVSLLAEQSLSNISAKLDMITDLLVIIDSVRGSKGFVVFATTDVPQILDPALRRPGRLDETICMPNLRVDSKGVTVTSGVVHIPFYQMFKLLNKVNSISNGSLTAGAVDLTLNLNNILFNQNYNDTWSPSSHTQMGTKLKPTNLQPINHNHTAKLLIARSLYQFSTKSTKMISELVVRKNQAQPYRALYKTSKLSQSIRYSAYNAVGRSILNFKTSNSFFQSMYLLGASQINQQTNINYLTMFGDYTNIMQQVMLLFAGHNATKISQLKNKAKEGSFDSLYLPNYNAVKTTSVLPKWKSNPLVSQKQNKTNEPQRIANKKVSSGGRLLKAASHANHKNNSFIKKSMDFKLATTIMLAFIQKRYLYHKNLIVPKLLNFLDGQLLDEPPSPPFSNVLIPAKRFENYKRVFRHSIFADGMYTNRKFINFAEKMQYYQELSSYSLSKTKSLSVSNPDFKYKEISSLFSDNYQTTTNMNWYFENRILKRHSQYLINQWWNGQLSEHNAESVFLSDIDWRSSFIKTNFLKNKNLTDTTTLKQKLNQNITDVFLDFPDAEQLYNPRRRRWFLTTGAWEFWFNVDKIYSQELLNHLVLESLIKTYKYFYKNGELLDYVTTKFITNNYLYGKDTLQSRNHKPESIYTVMQATSKGAQAVGL